jgi:hypothetical protein
MARHRRLERAGITDNPQSITDMTTEPLWGRDARWVGEIDDRQVVGDRARHRRLERAGITDNPQSITDMTTEPLWWRDTTARLSIAAVALGLVGALGAIRILPSVLLALVVAAFMLAGPGSLLLSWYTHLPAYAVAALVPAVSVAVCILVVAGLLMLGIYSPVGVLLGLTSATVVCGLLRCGHLAQRERATA